MTTLFKQEKAEADLEPLLRRVREIAPRLLDEYPRDVDRILGVALPSLIVRRKDMLTGADVKGILRKELDLALDLLPDEQAIWGLTFATDRFIAIFIDTHHGAESSRFTLAHEAGHLAVEYLPRLECGELAGAKILRLDPMENVVVEKGRKSPRREVVANACAAALLAPIAEMRRVVGEAADSVDNLVARVRAHFGLSQQAATIRLMELGLIPQVRLEGQPAI